VNDHTTSEPSALPARSFTPLTPPLTVAVYVDCGRSPAVVASVAVRVPAAELTTAWLVPPLWSREAHVDGGRLAARIPSLNIAVTVVASATPVAFAAGVTPSTTGGVVSGPRSV